MEGLPWVLRLFSLVYQEGSRGHAIVGGETPVVGAAGVGMDGKHGVTKVDGDRVRGG